MTEYALGASQRTTLLRARKRAVFDRKVLHQIIDESLLTHVGFIQNNMPFVIPTIAWRIDENIYIHGLEGGRMVKLAAEDTEVCLTFTLLDGLVMARSAFHHSANYRSAMVMGQMQKVQDIEQKKTILAQLVNHLSPGRYAQVRPSNNKELKMTAVLQLSLAEASVKMRTGPAIDDDSDMQQAVWAGVLPLQRQALPAITDEQSVIQTVPTFNPLFA